MHLAIPSKFTGIPLKLKETNISDEHNRLKNPNWREADQLAIYKHDGGVINTNLDPRKIFQGQNYSGQMT